MLVITNVVSPVMLSSVAEVASNVATTAGVIDGGAPVIMAPAPAGTDEASTLATAIAGQAPRPPIRPASIHPDEPTRLVMPQSRIQATLRQ